MKKLWFKAKKYGWGWYPASTEGWIITLIFLVSVIALALTLEETNLIEFLVGVGILVIVFIMICYKTGERPRWRWGE